MSDGDIDELYELGNQVLAAARQAHPEALRHLAANSGLFDDPRPAIVEHTEYTVRNHAPERPAEPGP